MRGFSEYERTGRLQRKIDVYQQHTGPKGERYWSYSHSTNWHRRCCDAVQAANRLKPGVKFKAHFDKTV